MRASSSPGGYSPLKNASCRCWYEADHTDFMGRVVDRTVDPYVITTIPNRLDTLGIAGGTFDSAGAARPPYGHLEAGDIAREVAVFDGTNHYHASSLAVANWTEAHQDWTWGIAARTTSTAVGTLCATQRNSALQIGCWVWLHGANTRMGFRVGDGSGIWLIDVVSANGTVPLNEVVVLLIRYSQAFGYDIRVNGANVLNGAMGAPAAGAPQGTLHIGSSPPALTNLFGGQIGAVIGCNEVLSVAAGGAGLDLEAFLAAKYQNNSVAIPQAPVFWFRLGVATAWELDEANPAVADQIDVMWDLGGNAHQAVQNVDADQGDARIHDPLFDNEDSVESNGTTDNYIVSAGLGWPAGTNHSFIVAVEQQDALGTSDILFDANIGRLIFMALTPTAGQLGISDGVAAQNAGAAAAGSQVLEWHLNGGTNTFDVFRAGVLVGVGNYPNLRALGGASRICSNWNDSASWFDGRIGEMYHRDSLLTALELWNYREELYELYPQVWGRVPGGEAWWNPTVAGNVQADAVTARVSQVNDTNWRGNNETQAVGADQPTLVTAADGVLALRFDGNNERLITPVVGNSSQGTLWAWALEASGVAGGVTRTVMGSEDGAADRTTIIKRGSAYEWAIRIGAFILNPGIAVVQNTWTFIACTWDGVNITAYIDDRTSSSASAEVAGTRAIAIGAEDENGVMHDFWLGDIGEHGVFDHALDPYDVAILRRQTTRGGTRETWVAPIIPGHVAWYNPCWGEVVTRSGANRISQVDDGHATVASGAQNNKTQGVAADQPLWVADGGDGVPAEQYDVTNTEFMDTGINPTTYTAGTLWAWFTFSSTGGTSMSIIGCYDGAATLNGCYLAVLATGVITARIGSPATSVFDGAAGAVDTWYFAAVTWDTAGNVRLYTNRGGALALRDTQAFAGAIPNLTEYTGAFNNTAGTSAYHDGNIGEHGIVDEELTLDQLQQLCEKTART